MDVQKAIQEYRMNEWIKIISECHSSGQTVKSWCLENGIRITSLKSNEVYKGKVTVSNDKMLHGIATPLVNFKEGKYKIQVKTKEGRLSGEKQFEITK
ncbi:hypothetical protein [Clostridium kluyveri]|uniref:Uncharacterized protein n=1 Tax=Clostridium kluyveri (strain ATCC 8527 / DSM 555 / NBRC 12016 / NCIMB 10680 / K1) TaxID=431943 RepID=A5N1W5_CLOK5|nr:Hypothetical protein CKL_3103 [Clostridium kluyveri DSM 555]